MQVRPGFLVFLMCVIWGFAQMANAQVGAESTQQMYDHMTKQDCEDNTELKNFVIHADENGNIKDVHAANADDAVSQQAALQCVQSLQAKFTQFVSSVPDDCDKKTVNRIGKHLNDAIAYVRDSILSNDTQLKIQKAIDQKDSDDKVPGTNRLLVQDDLGIRG